VKISLCPHYVELKIPYNHCSFQHQYGNISYWLNAVVVAVAVVADTIRLCFPAPSIPPFPAGLLKRSSSSTVQCQRRKWNDPLIYPRNISEYGHAIPDPRGVSTTFFLEISRRLLQNRMQGLPL
jgi:hypothetical protein